MPSKELARLKRLQVDKLSETRLRAELNKSKTNFETEIASLDKQKKATDDRLKLVTRNLSNAQKKLAAATKENEAVKAKLKEMEAERVAASRETFDRGSISGLDAKTVSRLEKLEVENVSLGAQLSASRALLDKLQAKQDDGAASMKTIATEQLMQKFAEDISIANKQMTSDFEIDDVEVDVRGAMGEEQGKLVLGLDAKRMAEPETSTRIKFNLKKRINTRLLDDQ